MKKCVISSPIATQSGYGHHAREFISHIIEQKEKDWDIKLLSMPWGNTPFSYPVPLEWQSKFVPLPLSEQPDIWVQITVPNEFQSVGKYNIGVTAGTEGDIGPKEWIESINKMNVIVVPSNFTKQTFINTAEKHKLTITTNIQVIPEYFDTNVYKPVKDKSLKILDDIHEQYCYLFVGHWLQGQLGEDRKNISGMINVFFEAFKNKPNVPALIVKTGGATYSITDKHEIEHKINQIRALYPKQTKLPNVYLLHGELTDDEMNLLYNHKKVKSMVSFTKAEGFGRPLLEFATTGKPIIAPHYSGQADFLQKDNIIALGGGLTPIHQSAQNPFLIGEAKWFTPDYAFAKKALKEVHKQYNKFLPNARKQKKYVNENFTRNVVKEKYSKLIDIIEKGTAHIPNTTQLQLPKLSLPTINKKGTDKSSFPNLGKSTSTLKLPKLNKV
jgi:glycosyltransferase involved in cell wall biosynthesis